MAFLKVEKIRGRSGGAAGICSGSYIYGLNGRGYGQTVDPEELLRAVRRCAAARALLIVGNDQYACKAALKKLVKARRLRAKTYPWSTSAKLVVAEARVG